MTATSLVRVQPGDLWQLGQHRLLCGDCTDPAAVARLMCPQEAADLLLTDPPYGVDYASKVTRIRTYIPHKWLHYTARLSGDNLDSSSLRHLLIRSLGAAPLRPGGVFYVFSPCGRVQITFLLALEEAGLELRQCLIWKKQHFVLGRQDYQLRHEMILYGWKGGAAHYFVADRTQDSVWECARPMKSRLHPTMKPIPILKRAILNSSRPGEVVFDGFGGSGSTLMACEATGRRCRMLEIDPQYCAVILDRWEKETGRQAVQVSNAFRG